MGFIFLKKEYNFEVLERWLSGSELLLFCGGCLIGSQHMAAYNHL